MSHLQTVVLMVVAVWQAWRIGANRPPSRADRIAILGLAWCLFRIAAKAVGG